MKQRYKRVLGMVLTFLIIVGNFSAFALERGSLEEAINDTAA